MQSDLLVALILLSLLEILPLLFQRRQKLFILLSYKLFQL